MKILTEEMHLKKKVDFGTWDKDSGYSNINAIPLERNKESSNEDFDRRDAFEKKLILRHGIKVQNIQI